MKLSVQKVIVYNEYIGMEYGKEERIMPVMNNDNQKNGISYNNQDIEFQMSQRIRKCFTKSERIKSK